MTISLVAIHGRILKHAQHADIQQKYIMRMEVKHYIAQIQHVKQS